MSSTWMEAVTRNLRYAIRVVVRAPAFALTVVLTLALTIGANSAVFSAIDAVLLKPLPFPDGDRLVQVRQTLETETHVAPPRLEDWRRLSSTFESLTGYYVEDVSDTTGDLPERVRRAVVAPDFLEVWGISPLIGRGFTEDEYPLRGSSATLISERYWRTRFGADRNVLEQVVRIEGESYSIAGVMPATFGFPDRNVDLWWPYPADSPLVRNNPENRQLQWYVGIGRLKPAATLEQARADLGLIQARLGKQYPDTDADVGVRIVPLKTTMIRDVGMSLWLLFGAVSVLLLIACTNIAALLLSRAAGREQEIAVRFSLGASRAGVAAQLLTETVVLAVAGAAVGLLVAVGASAALRRVAVNLPRADEMVIDARILVYTTASALVVAILCGLFPAVRGTRGGHSLSVSSRAQATGGHSLQWLLVGVQVALSVTLLIGAGLLLRSLDALSRVDPGFDPARVLAFRVSGNWSEEHDRDRLLQRIEGTLDELASLPGVESTATAWTLPGIPGGYQTEFQLVEGRSETEPLLIAEWRTVSPGYFETLQIPLLAGQLCRHETAGSAANVMANRSFAERYFAGRPVVGLGVTWEAASLSGRIVGIVGDARERGVDSAPVPTVYVCDSAPNPFPWFLVRASGDQVAAAVRRKMQTLEPLRSVYSIAPLEERIEAAYAHNRLRAVLLVLFAAAALSLACLGVYATLSYVVSLHRREVGVRVALGALSRNIVSQFLLKVMRVVVVACLAGVVLSFISARVLSGMLYGVSPFDAVTLSGVVVIVTAVAALAALLPAMRASRIDPMRALREE